LVLHYIFKTSLKIKNRSKLFLKAFKIGPLPICG
jgi:hypothetical protein